MVYNQLKHAITQGLLRAGDKLPLQRKLTSYLSIALATITRFGGEEFIILIE